MGTRGRGSGAAGTLDRRGHRVYLPTAGQMGGGGDPGRGRAPEGGSPPRCHVPPASGSARTRCSLRLRGAPSHGGTRPRPRWGADTGAGRAGRPRSLPPPGLDPGHCAAAPPPSSLRLRPAPCRWRLSDVSTAPPPLPASGLPCPGAFSSKLHRFVGGRSSSKPRAPHANGSTPCASSAGDQG